MVDATNFIKKNEISFSRTPSQIEIKQPLNKNTQIKDTKSPYETSNPYNHGAHEELRQNNNSNMQNSINNMNNKKNIKY